MSSIPVYLSYGTKMIPHTSFDPRAIPMCEAHNLVYAWPRQFPIPDNNRALEGKKCIDF